MEEPETRARRAGRPSFGRPRTTSEVDDRIAAARQRYLTAYFARAEGEAQFWVCEIIRLQNHRTVIERRSASL